MAKRGSKESTEDGRFREDGHVTFGFMTPGMKFILLRHDKVVRDNYHSTGVEVFVKLWQPAGWTKKWNRQPPALTEYPTAIELNSGAPVHIPDNQEVQILY